MTIDDGVAYGEPFQRGTASLRFDGKGVRLDSLNAHEGDRCRSPARRSSGGTAPTRSTSTGGVCRSSASPRSHTRRRSRPASSTSPPPAAARSKTRVTTCGSASTTCTSRRSRSGRSPARSRFAASEVNGELEASSERLALTGTGRISLHERVGCRPDLPVPRQLARSLRPAVRAAAVAVHDGRRKRLDPRFPASSRTSTGCWSMRRSIAWRCPCSTTPSGTRADPARRWTSRSYAWRTSSSSATRPS